MKEKCVVQRNQTWVWVCVIIKQISSTQLLVCHEAIDGRVKMTDTHTHTWLTLILRAHKHTHTSRGASFTALPGALHDTHTHTQVAVYWRFV